MASQQQLPLRPSLEQLRNRATDLLGAARAGDTEALRRVAVQLPGRTLRIQRADALTVIAREHGFASWARLKTYVEELTSAGARVPRRRGPRRTPGVQEIRQLAEATLEAARRGELFPFIFAPPIGPLRRAVQLPLREALVAGGNLSLVVDVVLRGAAHPNPRIRFECAHAMDWLADERCLPSLLALANDPVPRVRWIALHSLACDDCKLSPPPEDPQLLPLLDVLATSDPSSRVRQRALESRRLLARTKGRPGR
jgi:hypothetical protein